MYKINTHNISGVRNKANNPDWKVVIVSYVCLRRHFPRWTRIKNFPSSQVFEKEKGVETTKNSVFDHFWKIVELNTDVLEPSLLSEIDKWSLLFKMSLKPNWLSLSNNFQVNPIKKGPAKWVFFLAHLDINPPIWRAHAIYLVPIRVQGTKCFLKHLGPLYLQNPCRAV